MAEYKSNSFKSKETEADDKKVEKVVKGEVSVKKPGVGKKFGDVFLNETGENVKNYILFDVLLPAIKDAIVDVITNGTNMLFYGSGSSGRSKRGGTNSRTSYSSYYRGSVSRDDRVESRRTYRDRAGVKEIIFDNRADAQEVLECLEEILDKYRMVSVADYYELCGQTGTYTDRNYGWSDISSSTISRDRDGYIIKLPKAEPFD